MTITWQDARDKVRGDLWRPTTAGLPDDVVDRAIHASLLTLEAERRWLWLENVRVSSSLDEATAIVPLPSDVRSVTSLAFQVDGGLWLDPLTVLPIGRVRALAADQAAGWPSAYAFTGGQAFLDCVVSAGSVLDLVYTAGTPPLVEDAVAAVLNRTLSLHQAIVIAGACAIAAVTYLKNDAEAARQQAAFDRGLDRLVTQEDEARGDAYGGCVVPDIGYAQMAGR